LTQKRVEGCIESTEKIAHGQSLDGVSASPKEKVMKQSKFPPGWDETRVHQVLAHYEEQTEEEAVAEDEAAAEDQTQTVIEIPIELVPAVREFIAKYHR
jgi:hypothetical protein